MWRLETKSLKQMLTVITVVIGNPINSHKISEDKYYALAYLMYLVLVH